jgi:TIR domain
VERKILFDLLDHLDEMLATVDNVVLGRRARVGTEFGVEQLGPHKVRIVYTSPGDARQTTDNDLHFTGRVYFYSENHLALDLVKSLEEKATSKNILLICRGPEYAEERNRLETPAAFISHDSRDNEMIARPMAIMLRDMLCPVWFDEFSLVVGDNLRESIERGLKTCHMCIFVLTPNFLSKGGWPKREYEAIFTREIVEERELILPVWAGVGSDDVYEYSPILANRVALHWRRGEEEEVCRRLFGRLMGGN